MQAKRPTLIGSLLIVGAIAMVAGGVADLNRRTNDANRTIEKLFHEIQIGMTVGEISSLTTDPEYDDLKLSKQGANRYILLPADLYMCTEWLIDLSLSNDLVSSARIRSIDTPCRKPDDAPSDKE